jgi:hypothetical protein
MADESIKTTRLACPRSSTRRSASFVLLFAGLALFQMRTVDPFDQIPAGTESTATVPLFNLWTLEHNTGRITYSRDYWDAPIFHPALSTFALSEAQPHLVLLAPISKLASPTFAYNFYVFLNLSMNGVAGYLFVRRSLSRERFSALFCGGILQLLPFVNLQLGVLQLIPIWPFLLLLHCTWKLSVTPSTRSAVHSGLALGLAYLICNNYGLMAAILMLLAFAPIMLLKHRTAVCLRAGALAVTVFLAVAGPVVYQQWSVLKITQYTRNTQTVAGLSAQIADLAVNPWSDRISLPGLTSSRPRPLWGLSCGFVNYFLAICGIVTGLRRVCLRRQTALLTVILLSSILLSVLPGSGALGMATYETLCRIIPGLAQVRSFYRFVLFAHIATILLSSFFLSWCESQLLIRKRFSTTLRNSLRAGLAIVLVTGVLEIFPEPTYVCTPPWQIDPPFCQWIRDHTKSDAVLACFPFPAGPETHDYQHEVAWMLAGHFHNRAIVNGYSGFFPEEYIQLKNLATLPPGEELISRLKSMDVNYLLVREDWYTALYGSTPHMSNLNDVQEVHYDSVNSLRIYRLK